MIGALSIVRFRNPVKNPFELVMFFALITIGISMSVNMAFGLLLAVVINVTILASYFVEIFAKKFNFHIFSFSFEEGNSNNIIEIQANQEIEQLLGNKLLLQYISDKKSNDFHYRLASKSRIDKAPIIPRDKAIFPVITFVITKVMTGSSVYDIVW